MLKASAKVIGKTSLALLLLMTVVLLGIVIWLSTAPRSLPFARNALKEMIMDNTSVEDVTFYEPSAYLNIQELELELELLKLDATLPGGHVRVDSTRLSSPLFYILKRKLGFEALLLDNITITMDGSDPLSIPSLYIKPQKSSMKHTSFSLDLNEARAGAMLSGTLDWKKDGFDIALDAHKVPASLLGLVFKDAHDVNADIDGVVTLNTKKDFFLRAATWDMRAKDISVEHPVYYPKAVTYDALHSKGSWHYKRSSYDISSLHIVRGDMNVKAHAKGNNGAHNARVDMVALSLEELKKLWPHSVANEARLWVTHHLFDGVAHKGTITASRSADPKSLALDATFALDGVTVAPAPHLPKIYDASGSMTLDEDSFTVSIEKARALKSAVLRSGSLQVPSFTHAAIPMHIVLDLEGQAADVARVLSPKHLNVARGLNLREDQVSGYVRGELSLSFPLYPERAGLGKSSFDNLDLGIKARVKNVSQSNMMYAYDVSDFSGDVVLDNDMVQFVASGALNNVATELDVTHFYHGNKAPSTQHIVSMRLDESQFDAFDLPIPKGIVKGDMLLDVTIDEQEKAKQINATMDFKDSSLSLDQFHYMKPKGEAATLNITQRVTPDSNMIDKLVYKAKNASVSGALTLTKQSALVRADLPEVTLGDNTLSVMYDDVSGNIRLKGEQFRVPQKEKADSIPANTDYAALADPLLNRNIQVNFDKVLMDDLELRDVSFASVCGASLCQNIRFNAQYNQSDTINYLLDSPAGKPRNVSLRIDDVGSILKGLDASAHIHKGAMRFSGEYRNKKRPSLLQGNLIVRDMVLRKAPILTKLLTLASLRGIIDTLRGKGIMFEETTADITLENARLRLVKAAAKGDAMGVLVSGLIAPDDDLLDLEGTVIPSYTLNALPGKVPLIGELLVGGEDEGIFGTRFSVRGPVEDPDIIVNPLSMLTPGFLRNIFDVFPDANPQPELKP